MQGGALIDHRPGRPPAHRAARWEVGRTGAGVSGISPERALEGTHERHRQGEDRQDEQPEDGQGQEELVVVRIQTRHV